jgi:Flp pilus assembly protein TadB
MSPEAHGPVRDERMLGPTEDLDRQPDGVPHKVVGLTAGFSVVLAVLVAALFLTGHRIGVAAGILICAFAIPVLVASLRKKAATQRDLLHPSR